jgi:hypothetical protein
MKLQLKTTGFPLMAPCFRLPARGLLTTRLLYAKMSTVLAGSVKRAAISGKPVVFSCS